VDGQWADTDPVSATTSQYVKAGTGRNVLRVLARGDKLSLYINGTLVNTVKDDSISDGKIGAIAATGSNNSNAQVNFFRFTILTAEQALKEWGGPQPGSGAVLYKDDFAKSDSGWSVEETDNTAKYYKDGKYWVQIKNPGYTGWGVAGDYFSDGAVIDVDVTQTDGPTDNDYGVICQFQDDDNFYYLAIGSDGTAGVMKESGGGGLKVISGDGKMRAAAAIKKGKGVTNHLQAICAPGKLTLNVNGTQVVEVQDSDFKDGDVGLAASAYKSGSAGVTVSFDNFVVTEIP